MKKPNGARRFLFALAVALVLHAALVASVVLLHRLWPAQRKPPRPMVVELREKKVTPPAAAQAPAAGQATPVRAPASAAAQPAPPAAAAAQPALPAAPQRPDRGVAKIERDRPAAVPPKSSPPAAQAPPLLLPQASASTPPDVERPQPVTAGQGGPAPSAGAGASSGAAAPGQRLSLELAPGALIAKGTGNGEGGVPDGLVREKSPEEKAAEEKAVVTGRIRGWANDTSARARARDGRDGYWQQIQDKLAKDFKVDWDVLDKGGRRTGAARIAGEAAEDWQRTASAYGKSGNPFGEGGPGSRTSLSQEVTRLAPEDRGYRGDASLGSGLSAPLAFGAGSGDGPFNHRLVVFVMITQAEDGHIEDVHIQGGSGNHFYDGLALSRARALSSGTLGVPPRDHRQSLWAFETDFVQVPPLPIFGCALDGLFIPRDCYYPLKKMVKSRLRLEAVY